MVVKRSPKSNNVVVLFLGVKSDNEGILPGVDYINIGLEDQMVSLKNIMHIFNIVIYSSFLAILVSIKKTVNIL